MKEILIAIIVVLIMFAAIVWLERKWASSKESMMARYGIGPKKWPEFRLIPLKYKTWAPFTPDNEAWLPSEPKPVVGPATSEPVIIHYSSANY